MLAQHFVAFVLIAGFPIRDYFQMKHLRTTTDVERRTRAYVEIIVVMWLLTAVAILALGFHRLFTVDVTPRPSWFPSAEMMAGFLAAMAIGMVGALVATTIMIRRAGAGAKAARAFAKIDFILPKTPRQRLLWVLVALTAGTGEELLFRGFMFHYLSEVIPSLPLWGVLLLSAALFGFNHAYQGFAGAFGTAAIAIVFGLIFLATGSLAVPMILHTLIDLRVLAIPSLPTARS